MSIVLCVYSIIYYYIYFTFDNDFFGVTSQTLTGTKKGKEERMDGADVNRVVDFDQ